MRPSVDTTIERERCASLVEDEVQRLELLALAEPNLAVTARRAAAWLRTVVTKVRDDGAAIHPRAFTGEFGCGSGRFGSAPVVVSNDDLAAPPSSDPFDHITEFFRTNVVGGKR